MNRIEAFNGILKVNGRILRKGAKIKIKYKKNNVINATYIGYNEDIKFFEFERESKFFKGEKFILRIPTVQIGYRELYAIG